MEHLTDWTPSSAEAIQQWNRAREIALGTPTKFSALAPETLAAMLKDCKRYCAESAVAVSDWRDCGKSVWDERQAGEIPPVPSAFPPLTLFIGDDGLVYQQEAA